MLTALVLVVTHIVAAVGGAYASPHVVTLWTAWSGSRAVKAAQALVAKAEADAAALAAARQTVATKTVAAATSAAATQVIPPATAAAAGVTGVTGPHA